MDRSPEILESEWGSIKISVNGETSTFNDVKLYPGGARSWDWSETDTHHNPSIQPAEVKELIQKGANYVLLSRGRMLRLQVKEETKRWLKQQNVGFETLETGKLIKKYNRLRQQKPVGALIHTTC